MVYETRLTRNGPLAAMITQLAGIDSSAVECEKVLARNADDSDMMLTGHEREAIRMVRAVLVGVAEMKRDAR